MTSLDDRPLTPRARRAPLAVFGAAGLFALLFAAACGSDVELQGDSGAGGGDGCVWEGEHHAVGESFPAGDGCNTCSCEPDGSVGCTLIGCEVGCLHEGVIYAPGESFPAGDGCNTCSCEADGSTSCTAALCPETCTYEGNIYEVGQTFPGGGCSQCVCMEGGEVACSDGGPCEDCVYAGKTYAYGEKFPSIDGCNTCLCGPSGVDCTEMVCACDPAKEWWRSYVSEDPKTCQVIDFACPPNTQGFYNDCGCGCEQDASCPEWFDCSEPNPCDPKQIAEQCPYSKIAQ